MRFKMIVLSLMLYIGSCITPQETTAQASVSFQVFYDELSPYGMWIDNPDYGYVWVPNVASGFSPYASNGYWTYTDMGWTWVSNYQWGWAPFHYGRWYNDVAYGPIWVPGYEWGPGWVSWRRSGSYYGWAPMGPGVTMGMAYGSGYYDTYNSYTFVPVNYMGRTTINNYYVNHSNTKTIMNSTTVVNNNRVDDRNVSYSAGPDRVEVEKQTGRKFTAIAVKESSKPGQQVSGNQLQLYKPEVQRGNSAQKPAPTKVATLKEVKPMGERTAQPVKQNRTQPVNEQPVQPLRTNQSIQKREVSPQNNNKQQMDQQVTPRQNIGGEQPKRNVQPNREQPNQPLRKKEPVNQQPNDRLNINRQPTPKRNMEQPRQQPTQPQRVMPTERLGGEQQQQPLRQEQPQEKMNMQPSQPQQREPQQQQPNMQQTQPQRHAPQQNNHRINTGGKRPH